jgi:hypothetical protein
VYLEKLSDEDEKCCWGWRPTWRVLSVVDNVSSATCGRAGGGAADVNEGDDEDRDASDVVDNGGDGAGVTRIIEYLDLRNLTCPITAAGSDGRRNAISWVGPPILPGKNRPIWLIPPKPSQGNVPADRT